LIYPQIRSIIYKRRFIMADPFTITHLLMAATAGAALPAILGGKGKGLGITKDAIAEPSEEEKATYRGFNPIGKFPYGGGGQTKTLKKGGFVRGQGKAMRGGGCAMKGKRK
jgi:hypothetical protein